MLVESLLQVVVVQNAGFFGNRLKSEVVLNIFLLDFVLCLEIGSYFGAGNIHESSEIVAFYPQLLGFVENVIVSILLGLSDLFFGERWDCFFGLPSSVLLFGYFL